MKQPTADELIKNAIDMGYPLDMALDMHLEYQSKLESLWQIKMIKELKLKLEDVDKFSYWGVYIDSAFQHSIKIPDIASENDIKLPLQREFPDKYVELRSEDKLILLWTIKDKDL